jgi:hypothetical protein
MDEKKVVGRNVAIALGIICIILVAGISGIAVMLSNNIAQHNDYVSNHSYANDKYSNLNASLYAIDSQLDDLTSIVHLENSTTVYDVCQQIELPANFSTEPDIGEYGLSSTPPFGEYAGIAYVEISSNRSDTYVNVTYTAKNVFPQFNYMVETDIGTSGTLAFPVLPADMINLRIALRGSGIAYANVTITYRY